MDIYIHVIVQDCPALSGVAEVMQYLGQLRWSSAHLKVTSEEEVEVGGITGLKVVC